MNALRRPASHTIRGVIAGVILHYVFRLSAGDRGPVDFVVIGLVSAILIWSVVQLTRRMSAFGGGRAVWHVQRTLLFWIVGWMNTFGAEDFDLSDWQNWVGVALVAIAVFDTIWLVRRETEAMRQGKAHPA